MAPISMREGTAIEPARTPAGFGASAPAASSDRAQPPRAPELPEELRKEQDERRRYLRLREAIERRSMLRGLIVLAVAVLLIALARSGVDRAFPAGWLRRW